MILVNTMDTLKQKRLFTIREIKIYESKVFVREKKFGQADGEVMIPFQELSIEKTAHNFSQPVFLWASLFLYLIALVAFTDRYDNGGDLYAWLWISIVATASLAFYIIRKENSWKIKLANKNTYVFAFKNIPDTKTVDEFIDTLFATRNKYLRETYLTLDKNLNYEEQYKDLKWLLYIEAISKKEYYAKYDELKALFNKNQKAIGFDR
jgi:hypothetical protein